MQTTTTKLISTNNSTSLSKSFYLTPKNINANKNFCSNTLNSQFSLSNASPSNFSEQQIKRQKNFQRVASMSDQVFHQSNVALIGQKFHSNKVNGDTFEDREGLLLPGDMSDELKTLNVSVNKTVIEVSVYY